MFLCTSRFYIDKQEAKLLEKFFSYDEIEVTKEEKDESFNEVEIDH
jgi:hypothetical protein